MNVQRYSMEAPTGVVAVMAPYKYGNYVLEADHARIVAEMEQAHAAALAEERQRVLSMRFTEFMAAIKKSCPCICHEYTRDINPHDGKCVCNGGDGMETLGVAAPRTLTSDDEGYHSQRCLHCDHIRATHTLTASGCLGHAVPGRPGADCPCAEFIHDGEATPSC